MIKLGYQMKIVSYKDLEAQEVKGSSRLKIKLLNTEGSSNFAVRHCEIGSGGFSPHHSHAWENEIFVLEGDGLVLGGNKTKSIKTGDSISINADEIHQIKNPNKKPLIILCIIPTRIHQT